MKKYPDCDIVWCDDYRHWSLTQWFSTKESHYEWVQILLLGMADHAEKSVKPRPHWAEFDEVSDFVYADSTDYEAMKRKAYEFADLFKEHGCQFYEDNEPFEYVV